jgi:restriction system protein
LRADQFELLVAEIFRRQGYTVELSAAMGSEDGIDLTLRRDSETIIVQCKHRNTAEVGVGEIGEFSAAMISCGAPRGVLVTTGEFTAEGRVLAAGQGIDLMDGAALSESITATAKPGEDLSAISSWIEEFVAHARIFDPECPMCQGTMVIRHNRASGAPSWACRGYPRCPGRREPRLDLLPAPASR